MALRRWIGLHLTERCNIACSHCGTSSSPHAAGAFSTEMLTKAIGEIAALPDAPMVAFTGGEVFAAPRLFEAGLALVRKNGLAYGITTNGTWARNVERRKKVFDQLIPDCSSIGFSLDKYHIKYVDPHVVVDAYKEAHDRGMSAAIRYTIAAGEIKDEILSQLGLKGSSYEHGVHFNGVMAVGRAQTDLPDDDFFRFERYAPCTAVTVPTIRPNGDVFACCGESFYIEEESNPLFLGSILRERLGSLLSQSASCSILRAIRTIGPIAVIHESGLISGYEEDRRAWSPCGSCRLLFSNRERIETAHTWTRSQDDRTRVLDAMIYGNV